MSYTFNEARKINVLFLPFIFKVCLVSILIHSINVSKSTMNTCMRFTLHCIAPIWRTTMLRIVLCVLILSTENKLSNSLNRSTGENYSCLNAVQCTLFIRFNLLLNYHEFIHIGALVRATKTIYAPIPFPNIEAERIECHIRRACICLIHWIFWNTKIKLNICISNKI